MKKKKTDNVYLYHISECAADIERFLNGFTEKQFLTDDIMQSAILHKLEIIGEAAGRLSQDFRERHTDIPWKDMVGMRNKLIHDYFDIDLRLVWTTAFYDVPLLRQAIESWQKQ